MLSFPACAPQPFHFADCVPTIFVNSLGVGLNYAWGRMPDHLCHEEIRYAGGAQRGPANVLQSFAPLRQKRSNAVTIRVVRCQTAFETWKPWRLGCRQTGFLEVGALEGRLASFCRLYVVV